ncbi:MAG: hypothetical protein IJ025_00055 [Clostridia bacterium]|nr:hypothetical protein [Clostridia bacterium]
MKKALSVILVLSVLMGMFAICATAADTDTTLTTAEKSMLKIQRVDADGDGSYSTADAKKLLQAAAGIIENADGEQYDVNFDGAVSISDAQETLRIVSGISPVLTQSEALELFNAEINTVKSVRPGFEKTATVVCPSIKITTTNAPIADMNVTDLEFDKYVDKIIKLMNTFPYNVALNDEMKAQLNEMKVQAEEAYEPQTSEKTVAKHSNSHYSYFPVNNLGWSSKLTVADISGAACKVVDGSIVYTITLPDVTYVGDEYPTGSSGFAKRQTLPYGKVFTIPALDESDGSTVNKVVFKKGKVVLRQDVLTGDILSADYSYTYISEVMAPPQEDSELTMKTATTANLTENYIMNRVTV